jgi:hypothetical protein
MAAIKRVWLGRIAEMNDELISRQCNRGCKPLKNAGYFASDSALWKIHNSTPQQFVRLNGL